MSRAEEHLFNILSFSARVPKPIREYRFCARRWRFDFAWPSYQIAVEVEGGTWSKRPMGHSSRSGIARDCEKYNAATMLGWSVLRYTTDVVLRHPVQIIEDISGLMALTDGDRGHG